MLKDLLPDNWHVSKNYSKMILDCMITEKTVGRKQIRP